MAVMEVKKICVIGAGNMGHQISLAAALVGYKVKCTDINKEILQKAEQFCDDYLPNRVAKGKLTKEEAKAARGRVTFTNRLEEAAKEADLVIEAAIEKSLLTWIGFVRTMLFWQLTVRTSSAQISPM